jgi:thioredoxin-related protein
MKNIFLYSILLFLSTQASAQTRGSDADNAKIKWLTIEEAEKLQTENPKTILIDMYTDWCGWCKKFDAETFSHPSIASYINANFYPVKFDAERSDTVVYRGNTYVNPSKGGRSPHQLAQQLMGGRASYPTIVYIDADFRVNPVPGYMDANTIEPVLVYFAERINYNVEFSQYLQDFNNAFKPDSSAQVSGEISWLSLKSVQAKAKESNKKLLIFINSNYNSSSKMMQSSSLKHPIIAKMIDEHFYSAKFDYDTQDTITFQGHTFINEQASQGYPHQFAIALMQPELSVPSMIFFDEDAKLLYVLRGYCSPTVLERFLKYFGDDLYKEGVDWQEFNNSFESRIK